MLSYQDQGGEQDEEYETEEQLQARILAAALEFVPLHGWSAEAIAAGAEVGSGAALVGKKHVVHSLLSSPMTSNNSVRSACEHVYGLEAKFFNYEPLSPSLNHISSLFLINA